MRKLKMGKDKTKVYIYTRVSTAMQIDGYSLDAQKSRMKAFADYNDYEIVGEYEDAGKSGKSIEGRLEFNRMMEDIKTGKDGVSFVLVFKLSRFGRNAADVLSTLQVMQDFGVNLICVEDGIDSSKDAGKLMISVPPARAWRSWRRRASRPSGRYPSRRAYPAPWRSASRCRPSPARASGNFCRREKK